MNLRSIMRKANLDYPDAYGDIEISAVVSDSEKIQSNCVFVCISGSRVDGHSYIKKALDAGAAAVVVEYGRGAILRSERVIETKSTRRALSYLLDAFYSHPSKAMRLVGVTGTNGKTSVTNILKSIFETAGYKCGIIGTLGSFIGTEQVRVFSENSLANMTTPDPQELYLILDVMRKSGVRYVFIEASSHALYYEKLAPLWFECSIFTNLTPEHLDFHGSMDEYLASKQKLFTQSRLGIINYDSPYARAIEDCCNRSIMCSASYQKADYFAKDISLSLGDKTEYILCGNVASFKVSSLLAGEFNVMNTLQAATAALELGVDVESVRRAIESFGGVCGRMEKVIFDGYKDCAVFIDYAHTPDALENVLLTLKKLKKNTSRLTVLFGCGGDRDASKRKAMGRIAVTLADYAIITSDNCRSEKRARIFSDILEGVENATNYVLIPDRRDALCFAGRLAAGGDTVLLAGKGHEKYEIIGDERLPFDEYEIIKEFIEDNCERKQHK